MSDPISIAPHLQRALTAMSKDMAIEPQAIVNQAVFAWLRLNGYVLPGVASASEAPVQVAAPIAAVPVVAAPVIAPVVSTPTPPPVASPPAPVVVAPPPVIASTPTPVPEVAPALVRMAQIDADLEKLTKPWPAWSPAPPEEEEEEEPAEPTSPPEDQEQEEPEAPEEEAEEEEEEAPPPDEEISEKIAAAAAPPEEEPGGNTGETDLEENAGESTIVLRSAPIALYLERAGEEPIKVVTDRFIIGRGPHCDMVIDSPRVSREHVALTRKGVVYYLEDLNSSNGTWYGEERVTRRELESGDVISLGNEPVTFFIRAE